MLSLSVPILLTPIDISVIYDGMELFDRLLRLPTDDETVHLTRYVIENTNDGVQFTIHGEVVEGLEAGATQRVEICTGIGSHATTVRTRVESIDLDQDPAEAVLVEKPFDELFTESDSPNSST